MGCRPSRQDAASRETSAVAVASGACAADADSVEMVLQPASTTALNLQMSEQPLPAAAPAAAAPPAGDTFPLKALSLAAVLALAKHCEPHWTAEDVKRKLVLPATAAQRLAFVDFVGGAPGRAPAAKVAGLAPAEREVRQATVFVSHAWAYLFKDLAAALENWASQERLDPARVFPWIDLFSVNQHTTQNITQEWWSTVFARGIEATGHVVLVLAPWSNPQPLTRAWCLWEIFNAYRLPGVKFGVALSSEQESSLMEAVVEAPHNIVPTLCKIDGALAQASRKEDLDMILTAISRVDGGMGTMNKAVLDLMRSWLSSILHSFLDSVDKVAAKQTLTADEQLSRLQLRWNGTFLLSDLGMEAESLEIMGDLLKEIEQKHGTSSQLYRSCSHDYACALQSVGQTKEAADRLEKVRAEELAVLASLPGSDSSPEKVEKRLQVIRCTNNLAGMYIKLGRHKDAQPLLKETLAARIKLLGEDHIDALNSKLSLAECYTQTGDFEQAVVLHQETLAGKERALGSNHPDTLRSRLSLARAYQVMGATSEAFALFRGTLPLLYEKLGQAHELSLGCVQHLCEVAAAMHKFDVAEEVARDSYEMLKAKLGPDDRSTVKALHALTYCMLKTGRFEDVLDLQRQLLRGQKALLPPGVEHDANTIGTMGNMSATLHYLGRMDEALALKREVYDLAKAQFGMANLITLSAMSNLALGLSELGQPEEGFALTKSAYEHMAKMHADIVKRGDKVSEELLMAFVGICDNLAAEYKDRGNMDKYFEICDESLRLVIEGLGEANINTLKRMIGMSMLYRDADMPDKGVALGERAVRILDATFGPDDDLTWQTKSTMINTYTAAGRLREAVQTGDALVEQMGRNPELGPSHPDTCKALFNTIFPLRKLGELGEALKRARKAVNTLVPELGWHHSIVQRMADVRDELIEQCREQGIAVEDDVDAVDDDKQSGLMFDEALMGLMPPGGLEMLRQFMLSMQQGE